MHISAKEEHKTKYDFAAVLAKAIILVLLVYGAIGGFLSCYVVSYNKTFCVVVISGISLYLAAIYELKRKWLTNMGSFILLGGFFYYSAQKYWYLNSGYYAIVNSIFEDARLYLGVANRTEYAETIENQYATVTYFVIFIGIICAILLNIHFANKIRLWEVVTLTFVPQLLPMYFEKTMGMGYLICLLTGYFVIGILDGKGRKKAYAKQMTYLLPLTLLFVLMFVQMINVIFPNKVYRRYIPQNTQKELTKDTMSELFLYGAAAIFRGGSNAGISGGMLDGVTSVRPDYETDLIVRFTPYSYEPVYLKAFTAMRYEGNRWYHCYDGRKEEEGTVRLFREERLYDVTEALRESYSAKDELSAKGIMEITNVDATLEYEYYPYYTDFLTPVKEINENTYAYTYYPYHDNLTGVDFKVHEGYLEVSDSCYDAVKEICLDAGFHGSEMEVAEQIDAYFDENYKYTLRPGYAFGDRDYITRFLLQNKKGFCAHFASSATMLFRYMGIPARYVEGYVFTYSEIMANGDIVEDAEYSAYYSGHSPLGETGLIELEIPDANAHAWVEIYVEDKGWVVVDPTPMAEAESGESFWDVFGDLGTDELTDDGMLVTGEYLEQVANRAGQMFVWAIGAALLFFIGKRIYQWRKDAALTPQERVIKNYRILIKVVGRKQKEFASCRTVTEQMGWIKTHYRVEEINDEFVGMLYQSFFAPEIEEEKALSLLIVLKRVRKRVKRRIK